MKKMVHITDNIMSLSAVVGASLMLSPASAATYPFGSKFKGDGTYYGDVSPSEGNCAIEHPIPSTYNGMIPMAISLHDMYDDSTICGACIEGTGTGKGAGKNPIKGKFKCFVSDSCEECAKGDLDFAKSGDGRSDIEWKFLECPSGGNPSSIFEGSNGWYRKIQARETESPVTQVWVDGKKATMTQDKFFTASGGPFYGE